MPRLFLITPDGQLSRAIYAADGRKSFEVVRFRSLQHAFEKEQLGIPIVQWTAADILTELSSERRRLPLIVYCPELTQRTVAENEAIRFALLQLGAVAVFSQLRELPTILPIIRRYAERFPPPQKYWTQAIYDSLPWKT